MLVVYRNSLTIEEWPLVSILLLVLASFAYGIRVILLLLKCCPVFYTLVLREYDDVAIADRESCPGG